MKIKSIIGPEPVHKSEYPTTWFIDYDGVTEIREVTENLGTYGITWYEVHAGDKLIAKMNALHTAEVRYAT
jgi:hypothetical protein